MKKQFLSDNIKISNEEFNLAKTNLDKIIELKNNRDQFLIDHNLSPEIFIGTGFWGSRMPETGLDKSYQLLANKNYNTINQLRHYAQPFTGWETNKFDDLEDSCGTAGTGLYGWFNDYEIICKNLPSELVISGNNKLGEVGWHYKDRIINFDICGYQHRISLMYHNGILNKFKNKITILEIGSGYGGFAFQLKKLFPHIIYYCIDIPESLAFATTYLNIFLPNCQHTINEINTEDFSYFVNYYIGELPINYFDLIINCISLDEMSPNQISFYGEKISHLLKKDGFFYEQNGLNLDEYFNKYFKENIILDCSKCPFNQQGTAKLRKN